MISRSLQYGIQAAMSLSSRSGGDLVTAHELSEALDIPQAALAKTLHVLAREGFIHSVRGPRGGCRWKGKNVSLGELAEVFGARIPFDGCCLGLSACQISGNCPIAQGTREKLAAAFRTTTILSLAASTEVAMSSTQEPTIQ